MTSEEREELIEKRDKRFRDSVYWYENADEDEYMRAIADVEKIDKELEAEDDD